LPTSVSVCGAAVADQDNNIYVEALSTTGTV
jgi:hypothetical protein